MNEIEAIYLGRRALKAGTGVAFITPDRLAEIVNETDPAKLAWSLFTRVEQAASYFKAVGKSPGFVGGTFTVQADVTPEGKIVKIDFSKFLFVKQSSSAADLMLAWTIADDDVETAKRVKYSMALAEKNTALARAIETLRRQYKNVPPGHRRAFTLWLLNEIDG